eukprot:TRINITY_DN61_c0_g1_i14.p1 TRINITY_DN61_c0_g1~~TRINITY_DN61_c0_g1_i14.p1  ORF type:complete len:1143 (-),score=241.82 TRINITY_DN61_c0_g1_i14:89-3493(-)
MRTFFALALVLAFAAAQTCTSIGSDCNACVRTTGCGYCVDTRSCRAGTATGPSSGAVCYNWRFWTSQSGNPIAGFPVNPNQLDVFLVANQPLAVTVTVTIPLQDTLPLDVYFIQDASGSMSDDIAALYQLAPRIVDGLLNFQYDTWVGLGSFIDIRNASNFASIWRHQHHLSLVQDYQQLVTRLGNLGTTGNFDNPETAMDSLFYGSICPITGWRPAARKIILGITDDFSKCEECQECTATSVLKGPHASYYNTLQPTTWRDLTTGPKRPCGWYGRYARDGTIGTEKRPLSNIPTLSDSGRLSTLASVTSWCSWETISTGQRLLEQFQRHPSFQQMKDAMINNNILPIFMSATPSDNWNVTGDWVQFTRELGFGVVAQYSVSNSDGFVNSIINAITSFASQVSLDILSNPNSYITSVTPALYTGLSAGQRVSFTVNLRATATVTALSQNVLRASGLGNAATSTLNIRPDFFPCNGCNNVANSDLLVDACGVCGGNNSTCTDCRGTVIPAGGILAANDICGVCEGDSTSCIGCDGVLVPPPGTKATLDRCGVCSGTNQCLDCAGVPFGNSVRDLCGVCRGNNTCLDCLGTAFGTANRDNCGVCQGSNECYGCDGVPYSGKLNDLCGVCGGNNTCVGCDGIPNSGKTLDLCGVCDGSSTCFDCFGTRGGSAIVDACGVCGGTNACFDCFGTVNGTAVRDACGVCGGSNNCYDCNNVAFGPSVVDLCGVCGGNNTCVGCDGLPNSGRTYDRCGVCQGNDACVDCFDVPFGTARRDLCGVCGGTNDCLDCLGVVNGTAIVDGCGVCAPSVVNACYGCDGVPNSGLRLDSCGVCDGNNDCIGCDGIINSGKVVDLCGVCGGSNACADCFGVINGPAFRDICGVCNGTSDCISCDQVVNGTTRYDACGICGGDNSTCIGCDGIVVEYPGLPLTVDLCGVCGGDNSTCIGCDGIVVEYPGLPLTVDLCGVCGGDNSTCIGCDGFFVNTTMDLCGVCGGNNLCLGCDGVPNSGLVEDACGVCNGTNACLDCKGQNLPVGSPARFELDACKKCKNPAATDFQTNENACNPDSGVPAAVVIGTATGFSVLAAAGAVAAIIAYKRWKDGADWYFKDAIENAQIMGSNPLYEAAGREKFSPLYQGK